MSAIKFGVGVEATEQGATIAIMQHGDGVHTLVYSETHRIGMSLGRFEVNSENAEDSQAVAAPDRNAVLDEVIRILTNIPIASIYHQSAVQREEDIKAILAMKSPANTQPIAAPVDPKPWAPAEEAQLHAVLAEYPPEKPSQQPVPASSIDTEEFRKLNGYYDWSCDDWKRIVVYINHWAAQLSQPRTALPDETIVASMVNRFLCWPLPKTFSPDNGIVFNQPFYRWPSGTNLFNVVEAKAMFEYCLRHADASGAA